MHLCAYVQIKNRSPKGEIMDENGLLPRTFQALSDPTRLRMFRLLAANRTQMCVCEFVDSLEERQYAVSRHLKILGLSGLLRKQKEGRRAYYGLDASNPTVPAFSRLVATLPDPDGTFARDQQKFEEQMPFRRGGDRCRQCTVRRKTRQAIPAR